MAALIVATLFYCTGHVFGNLKVEDEYIGTTGSVKFKARSAKLRSRLRRGNLYRSLGSLAFGRDGGEILCRIIY